MKRACIAVWLLFASVSAHAQLYSDWWWNPAQSGTGINVGHEGNSAFMAWFTYDDDGDGMWLVMGGPLSGTTLDADMYRTTGPALGSVYTASAVVATKVGHGTLSFADPFHATLIWAVNGKNGTLALVRETFGAPTEAGLYLAGFSMQATTQCADFTGLYRWPTKIALTDTAFVATEQTKESLFTYPGPLQREGRWITSHGTYTGAAGVPGIPFQGGAFTIATLPIDDAVYIDQTLAGNAGCVGDVHGIGLQ